VGWDVLREQRFAKQVAMGLFPEGTELSPRDASVPAWDSLTPEMQNEFVNRMAIYAAQIDAIDKGIGKLVAALKEAGQFENTVIMMMDDNAACAESLGNLHGDAIDGSSSTYESYRRNWANLSSTPYREYKHYTNEGGIATPLIVSWPAGISQSDNGTFVREYGYFADIMATCVDLGDAKYPKTYKGNKIQPCEGVSLVPNFKGKHVKRGMTFWEHEINIAVRDGKWKLNILNHELAEPDLTNFELYDMEADPTELHNLADQYPERAQAMFDAWDKWANRVGAYPLCNDGYGYRAQGARRYINGDFTDNLGHWTLNCSGEADVTFSIDTETTINGKTALVDIKTPGERPNQAFMMWKFQGRESTAMDVAFSYIAENDTYVWVRLENQKDPTKKDFSQKVMLPKGNGRIDLGTIEMKKGNKQFALYFGDSPAGKVWLDDIKMDLN